MIEGLEQLNANFNKLLSKTGVVNEKALGEVGLDLLGKSVDKAPIDTGDLRGSGSMKPAPPAGGRGVRLGQGGRIRLHGVVDGLLLRI